MIFLKKREILFTENGAGVCFMRPGERPEGNGEVGGEHGGAVGDQAEALDAAAQVGAERVHQQRKRREEGADGGQHALSAGVLERNHKLGPVAVHRHRPRHAAHHALAHAITPTVSHIPESRKVEKNMGFIKNAN